MTQTERDLEIVDLLRCAHQLLLMPQASDRDGGLNRVRMTRRCIESALELLNAPLRPACVPPVSPD